MRYRNESGLKSIRDEETRISLEKIEAELLTESKSGSLKLTLKGKSKSADAELEIVDGVITLSAAKLKELCGDSEPSFVHVGVPLGIILPVNCGDVSFALTLVDSARWGSREVYVGAKNECICDYMIGVMSQLHDESCGRCVFCREGSKQLRALLKDATTGNGNSNDIPLIAEIADAMKLGAFCIFGKATGALVSSVIEGFKVDYENHIRRKRCDAMVCREYLSYVILGAKCIGCGDCMDECDEDAIEGKKGFIHMINTDDCTKCGACVKACDEDAIILAGGSNMPRVPTKLTRVGAWRG